MRRRKGVEREREEGGGRAMSRSRTRGLRETLLDGKGGDWTCVAEGEGAGELAAAAAALLKRKSPTWHGRLLLLPLPSSSSSPLLPPCRHRSTMRTEQ
jgi:hypothetical protein